MVKLIDTSKCIGCKACQSACLEWNDMREPVGVNVGVYDNPHDLTPNMFTLMRFTEWENPQDRQSRVADPQGRLHALRGSGLPQGLPGARRHRAVRQRHRRLRQGELHRLRLLREGLSVQHPAHLPGRQQGLQVHAVLGPGGRRPAAGLRQGLPDALHHVRHQGGDGGSLSRSGSPTSSRAASTRRVSTIRPASSGTHVMYVLHHADQPQLYAGLPDNPRISPIVEMWKGVSKYAGMAVIGLTAAAGVVHHLLQGPTASPRKTRRSADKLAGGKIVSDARQGGAHIRVRRYSGSARINHWIVAISFVLLLLSGLSLFHPSLYGLTALFGGGADRALAASVDRRGAGGRASSACSSASSGRTCPSSRTSSGSPAFATCWRHTTSTCPRSASTTPARSSCSGRRLVLVAVMLVTGIGLWEPGLAYVEQAARLQGDHRPEAVGGAAPCRRRPCWRSSIWIIHVYAAIWVRGTISAMTRGTVTGGWGWRHHRKWLRKEVDKGADRTDTADGGGVAPALRRRHDQNSSSVRGAHV